MNYAIPYLTVQQLNALQNAIVAGALSRQVRSLQLAIAANTGHTSIQDQFLLELTALQEAGRAIMNACPVEQTREHMAAQALMNLGAIHHVYGYNTKPFQEAYLHGLKQVRYNWELLASDMPVVSAERGRSLT